jgi:membrane-bound ClpP family serine protease
MSERVRRSLARVLAAGLSERQRNGLALVLVAIALAGGTLFSTHRIDLGVALTEVEGRVFIGYVQPGGLAWRAGAREGARPST